MTTTRRVETSHATIEITETAGAGPVVLMLHGNSSCKEVFRNQLEGTIGAEFHCIGMDLPGHGASSNASDPERTYWMPGYADCAIELMAALGHDRYAVLGWSLGGHIGIEMLRRTDRISRLMISGTPPVARSHQSVADGFRKNEHMHLAAQADLSEAEVEAYARATCGINAPYEPFLRSAVARTDGRARALMFSRILEAEAADNREVVTTTQVPLAIVNGAEDPFVNIAYVASIPYSSLWEGRVHNLAGVGHAPFWEAPAEFDPILQRFLLAD